ncbi:unnamed protein product [Paramecium pentaurelia]|uniref:Uncharacterized protein n=1 Tax=Paramecium pentaurelia TaxID=43138 RepID=A0A8S1YRA8_9CILI|nr:unnamed protein product [Paramecium pentaurelia]
MDGFRIYNNKYHNVVNIDFLRNQKLWFRSPIKLIPTHIYKRFRKSISQISIFYPKLEQFNQFDEYIRCKQMLSILELSSQKFTQSDQQQLFHIYQNDQEIQQDIQNSHQSNTKPFNYQLIQDFPISQTQQCCPITIEQDCLRLAAGFTQIIKLFELNSGMIKNLNFKLTQDKIKIKLYAEIQIVYI